MERCPVGSRRARVRGVAPTTSMAEAVPSTLRRQAPGALPVRAAAGRGVFYRRGEYAPGSPARRDRLAHELTHVVQQNGKVIRRSPDDGFEGGELSLQDRLASSLLAIMYSTDHVDVSPVIPVPQIGGTKAKDVRGRATERRHLEHRHAHTLKVVHCDAPEGIELQKPTRLPLFTTEADRERRR